MTAITGTTRRTRGQAIADHCRECIYDRHAPGTWRMQVAACTVSRCALYAYRPLPRLRRPEVGT